MKHQIDERSKLRGSGKAQSLATRLLLSLVLAMATTTLIPATSLAASSATTNPATKVHHRSAVLNGHLDPDADPGVTECHFEWGATVAYGDTAPCNEGNFFASAADVTANLSFLTPGATYHFRLDIETTSSGPFQGADQSFRPDTFPISRPEIGSFGPDGTSATSFSNLFGIAFNQAARKLYTLDRRTNKIYGFDASSPSSYSLLPGFDPLGVAGPAGTNPFADQPDVAVDSTALGSAGNVYYVSEKYTDSEHHSTDGIFGYSPSGAPLPGFPVQTATGRGCGAAVDSAGHLWVGNHEQKIEEFSSAGALLGSVETPNQGSDCKLAFDTNDDMYVVSQNGVARKYTAASGYASSAEFAPSDNNNVAVDPSTHDVYLGHYAELSSGRYPDGYRVDEYDSAGHFLGEFGLGVATHVTVDGANHHVFATGTDGKIHVYGDETAPIEFPTATTGTASAITGSVATLNGAVDPEGVPVTDCHIAWGQDTSYGNSAPCSPNPGSGSGDVAISANISGLSAATTYHFRVFAGNANGTAAGKDSSFTTHSPPSISATATSNVTTDSADLGALVNPKGSATTYRFEWGTTPAYGNVSPVPDGNAGSGEGDVPVSAHLSGLAPNSRYHWRLVAESVNGASASENGSFLTLGAPIVETTGDPLRTTTTIQLAGRVAPRGFATSYHFEYGEQGPCDANPCAQTETLPAGSGEATELAAASVEGLQPNTTYHYRLVADNGQPGSPVFGEDMTVTTRASDAPLSHGHFPGPPGSDRAWEMVSPAETSGNPVGDVMGYSADGDRVLYTIPGGNPLADTGNLFTPFYSSRDAAGWHPRSILPPRKESPGTPFWVERADAEVSVVAASYLNENTTESTLWRLDPNGSRTQLFEGTQTEFDATSFSISSDGSRILARLRGSPDPEHPVSGPNVYDMTSGAPHLVNLMPDGSVPSCEGGDASLSPDGSRAIFRSPGHDCAGFSHVEQLYVRDFDAAETELASGPPVSGQQCAPSPVKITSDAVFFWTQTRLTAEDTVPSGCAGELDGDVYRYNFGDGALKCLTCLIAGVDADVFASLSSGGAESAVAVSEDGSRVYFQSPHELLLGTPTVPAGGSTYRLDVETGDLAWIAGPEVDLVKGTRLTAAMAPLSSSAPVRRP